MKKKYKIKFTQETTGLDTAECIIDAETREEAVEKFNKRDFTSYLVTKRQEEYSNEEMVTVSLVKDY